MFIRLRNRFLLLNLVIITILMVLTFLTIFLITYRNVRNDIDQELGRISGMVNPRDISDPKHPAPGPAGDLPRQHEQSVSFSILTDTDWNSVNIISNVDLDDSLYETAKSKALSGGGNTGTIDLNGNTWAFMIKTFPDGSTITFVNTTSRQAILTNLIYTFLAVAVIMLLFIFIISKFFADRAIEPIKNAFDKQKQFIADSSHELKTPLSVINTNVDVVLANEDKTVGSQLKWLRYIKSEAERMTKLTNDLLYLAQVDNSEGHIIHSEFNLSDEIINVILTMEAVVYESGITLNYEKVARDIAIKGNRDQLAQVVMILLDNAVKYADQAGRIDVSLEKTHHRAILTVTNTGKGIPKNQIGNIFDRFFRTDASRSRKNGGYGLGLAIAKTIVLQHGGEIRAESVPDNNTTFTVDLPL